MTAQVPVSKVKDARPWSTVPFPKGGTVQHEFKEWFTAEFPGVEFNLYDGDFQHDDEQNEDGTYWHWRSASIGTWNLRDGVKAFTLRTGNYLLYRDVLTPALGATTLGQLVEFYSVTADQMQKNYEECS